MSIVVMFVQYSLHLHMQGTFDFFFFFSIHYNLDSFFKINQLIRFIVDPARYRKIKSIKISIQNAKDIYSIALVQGKLDLYCVIVFNGIEMAKTQTKYNTGSPVWGETFLFE